MTKNPIFGVLGIVLVAFATLALTTGRASADVIINFEELPNEGGIHLGGVDANGNVIDVTKLDAESFHISSPAVPPGYAPDAILSQIGISRVSDGFLINILESDGGPISDQVYVHQFIPGFTVIDFISDPDQFFTGITPFATFVETGFLQNVLNYNNDRGGLVSINVLSDVELVPEPASLTLLGIAGVCLGGGVWRRRRMQAVKANR